MDLRNHTITVRELLADEEVRRTVERHFPGLTSHPMLPMAQNMALSQRLRRAAGRVPKSGVQALLEELQAL